MLRIISNDSVKMKSDALKYTPQIDLVVDLMDEQQIRATLKWRQFNKSISNFHSTQYLQFPLALVDRLDELF